MRSTMQDFQLTIGTILRHCTEVHGDGQVVTATADSSRTESYAEIGRRAPRLANALRGLGISGDQRVATFQWNNAEHLESYLTVPAMGAVLHTLNIRLFPDQLTYIANHADDKVQARILQAAEELDEARRRAAELEHEQERLDAESTEVDERRTRAEERYGEAQDALETARAALDDLP